MFEFALCPMITAGMPASGPRQHTMLEIPRVMLATARPDVRWFDPASDVVGGGFMYYQRKDLCSATCKSPWCRVARHATSSPSLRYSSSLSFNFVQRLNGPLFFTRP